MKLFWILCESQTDLSVLSKSFYRLYEIDLKHPVLNIEQSLFDPSFASYAIVGDLNAAQRLSLPCR
tara:strand:+ start:16 stop:213 length:198 start_codon:yes stop_codon:yes gene_type:complete